MRRIYKVSDKRQKITQDTLSQIKKLRSRLDPDTLSRARSFAENNLESILTQMKLNSRAGTKQNLKGEHNLAGDESMIPLDKTKNVQTVMQFLQTATVSKSLKTEVHKELVRAMKTRH